MKKCKYSPAPFGGKRFFLSSLFILAFSFTLNAQTADEIISQHLENSGGYAHWKSLNSIIIHGDALLGLDQAFPMTIYHRRPYQKKVVFLVEGKEMLNEGYDGKNAWTFNSISGKNEKMLGYEPDSFESDLMDYKKKGFKAEFLGEDLREEDERKCYKVELTKNVNKSIYCFATDDYSLLWEENKEEKLFYYDYKIFDGLSFATRIIGQPKEGGEYVLYFSNIRINPNIDAKEFRF